MGGRYDYTKQAVVSDLTGVRTAITELSDKLSSDVIGLQVHHSEMTVVLVNQADSDVVHQYEKLDSDVIGIEVHVTEENAP